MTQKCVWCNKQSCELKEITVLTKKQIWVPLQDGKAFVCPEHEEKFCKFNDYSRRYGILFIGLCTILTVSLVVSALLGNYNYLLGYLFVGSFASIGLVMFIFPFCSPGTFEFMSIATSIKVARIMGGVIFTLGAVVLVLTLFYGQ